MQVKPPAGTRSSCCTSLLPRGRATPHVRQKKVLTQEHCPKLTLPGTSATPTRPQEPFFSPACPGRDVPLPAGWYFYLLDSRFCIPWGQSLTKSRTRASSKHLWPYPGHPGSHSIAASPTLYTTVIVHPGPPHQTLIDRGFSPATAFFQVILPHISGPSIQTQSTHMQAWDCSIHKTHGRCPHFASRRACSSTAALAGTAMFSSKAAKPNSNPQ